MNDSVAIVTSIILSLEWEEEERREEGAVFEAGRMGEERREELEREREGLERERMRLMEDNRWVW